jgi:hypothetical protein
MHILSDRIDNRVRVQALVSVPEDPLFCNRKVHATCGSNCIRNSPIEPVHAFTNRKPGHKLIRVCSWHWVVQSLSTATNNVIETNETSCFTYPNCQLFVFGIVHLHQSCPRPRCGVDSFRMKINYAMSYARNIPNCGGRRGSICHHFTMFQLPMSAYKSSRYHGSCTICKRRKSVRTISIVVLHFTSDETRCFQFAYQQQNIDSIQSVTVL